MENIIYQKTRDIKESSYSLPKEIQDFNSLNLEEIHKYFLEKKHELKFLFKINLLDSILQEAIYHYDILEINDKREQVYQTTYFDTHDLDTYHDHHNGKSNRYKIRKRYYTSTKDSYWEIKIKKGQDKIKKRILTGKSIDDPDVSGFINKYTPYMSQNLFPKLFNQYNRITLASKCCLERVTIDYHLVFPDPGGKDTEINHIAIAEIKKEHQMNHSFFYEILKKHRVRPIKISKYCIGLTLLNQIIKTNRFKSIVLNLNKLKDNF
ncbi:MAG: polyphosphate polymerase domain-containing protein [bacterium]